MKLKNSIYATLFAAICLAVSCSPDEVSSNESSLVGPELDASFTVTSTAPTVDDQTVTVTASSNDPDIQYHIWVASNVQGVYPANGGHRGESYTFTFTKGGTYKLKHIVTGYTGGYMAVSEQSFFVDLPEPEFGDNIVVSPNFENASDWASFQTSNEPGVSWVFNSGSATASGGTGNYPGSGIYQAVTLEAGQYMVDMHVQGAGSTDTWFEVFVGSVMPQNQADYSDGGAIIALNTWNGCGNSAFDGQLDSLSCAGSGNPVTIDADGTYYLVIKTGSGAVNGVNNITVTDVTLKKVL